MTENVGTPPGAANTRGSDRQTPLFTNKKIVDLAIDNIEERQAQGSNEEPVTSAVRQGESSGLLKVRQSYLNKNETSRNQAAR